MTPKTILTVLESETGLATALPAALTLAAHHEAHLRVLCLGIDQTQAGLYMAGAASMITQETLSFARNEALALEARAQEMLSGAGLAYDLETALVQSAALGTVVARAARFADLVVQSLPYGEGLHPDAPAIVEAAMFAGRAPVIVLPAGKLPTLPPRRVVIAWNESTESLTAARRALPYLKAADLVDILIIDPDRHMAGLAEPGHDLALMLTRHGVRAQVSVIAQTTPRISDQIHRYLVEQGGDLLVMGAYGHSRLREAILGGATRNLLAEAHLPVLMAH